MIVNQNRRSSRMFAVALVACSSAAAAFAQNAAPSSHLVFDDNFDGDIIINEVRVPKAGEAMYTYYEALGWRGRGAGYAGIQAHPKAHLYIFSIWDHKDHAAPIKAVYRGPGTETVGFGGEGTGLKSWNFELGWSTDVWYTLVARNWPVGDHTHYGFWVRAGDTKRWTHLVTMDVAAKASFQGGTDAFIEDWVHTGANPRTTHLRGGWKRKTDGTWFSFGSGRYSVNSWDLAPGKRSYDYRMNWNGGVQSDETGEFYFMISGGAETAPTTTNPSKFAIKRQATEPDYAEIKIRQAKVALKDAGNLSVSWDEDKTTTPPFSHHIKIFDNPSGLGKPLATASRQVPHARSATVDVSGLKLADGPYYLHLECVDILDRRSETTVLSIPAPGD
jgi:hypothetical protein